MITEAPERYCVDCRHFDNSQCKHPLNFSHKSLVTGESFYALCAEDMRATNYGLKLDKERELKAVCVEGPCGSEAKLFEPNL